MTSNESVNERVQQVIKQLGKQIRRNPSSPIPQRIEIEFRDSLGASALEPLTLALNDPDVIVRRVAVRLLGFLGELAMEALSHALDDLEAQVRLEATTELCGIGEPALKSLGRALEDPDQETRAKAFQGLYQIGKPALPLLAIALEDSNTTNVDTVIRYYRKNDIDARDIAEALVSELVIRKSGRPSEYFSYDVVTAGLQSVIGRNPRLHGQVLLELRDLAYQYDNEVRQRAVAVARTLDIDEFAMLIKVKSEEDPTSARAIMSMLGGSEAMAFFVSESQKNALERFREPLLHLEAISQTRWEELTTQTRQGFYINMVMSVALFLVGVAIVIWGLCLLTRSNELAQQITGGILAGLSALATTFSGRFWKDPVEHIKGFSAQQARLQAAFIGYMNRVAQLRLVFEHDYATGEVTLDKLKDYQKMLSEAIDQASQQLGDGSQIRAQASSTTDLASRQ